MKRVITLGAVAVALAGTLPAAAQTNGYRLACSSAQQLGAGCATLAVRGEPASLLNQPAGLAFLGRPAVSISGAAFAPVMEYHNNFNGLTRGEDNIFPLPAMFVADRARGPLTLGLGVQTVGGMGADFALTHPVLGAGQRYHSKFGLLQGGIAAAVRVAPQLAIGGTFGALYGQLEFATPYAVNPAQLAGMAGLAQDPDYAPMMAGFTEATAYADLAGLSGFGITGGVSIEYRPVPALRLAAAWTAPSTLRMDGGTASMDMAAQFGMLYQGMVAAKGGDAATVDAQLGAFGINPALGMATVFDAAVDFGVPQTLTFAVGVTPHPRWDVGLDVGYVGWESAFSTLPMAMADGSNPNINILMNADPTDGTFAAEWPLRWKDAWTVRGGVVFAALPTLRLRVGGIYGTDPVASEGLFTIFPAIAEGSATFGLGWVLGRTELNAGYALTFKREQTAASQHIVAAEFADGCSHLTEHTLALGLGWRF